MRREGRKQVLIVIDSLRCGGAEKSLVALLRRLEYERMDVDLFVRRRGGMYETDVPPQVNFVDYAPRGLRKCCMRLSHAMAIRLGGRKRHGAETEWKATGVFFPAPGKTYDVAIAYQQGVPTFLVSEKINARRKMAWINADLAQAGYDAEYCRPFYDRMERVIAVSEALSAKVVKDGYAAAEKVDTVYDIIDVAAIRDAAGHACELKTLPQGAVRIVTVARLSSPKNHLLAVRAAALLKERGIDFLWHFVGEGPERASIEREIEKAGLQDHVVLEGLRQNPYPYFAAADIYVQTSSFEGFGITLTEARILGRPVVTTDFAVARDQIHDGKNGLIAGMTPESVADKIVQLASDRELRDSLGMRAAAETNYTAETEGRKVNQLICEE